MAVRRVIVGTAAATATVAAITAAVRSDAAQRRHRAAASELRQLVVDDMPLAADVVAQHGMCVLPIVLKESPLPAEFSRLDISATAAARAAGAAAAMLLPTVHQADGWKNMALGQAIGDRVAAAAAQMGQEPTLLGCAEAVAALEPHAAASRFSRTVAGLLGLPPVLSLVLQSAGDTDVLASLLEGDAGADVDGATGPRAALARSWAGVLLQPALAWVGALDRSCEATGAHLTQRRTRLLLTGERAAAETAVTSATATAAETSGVEAPVGPVGSVARLSWIGSLSTASLSAGIVAVLPVPLPGGEGGSGDGDSDDGGGRGGHGAATVVELLLPAGPVPALRVAIQPGAALLIDGRARWRPAEDEGTAALTRRAFVVFEYVDEGSAGALLPAVLTAARQAAAAAVWGVVPLPGEGRPNDRRPAGGPTAGDGTTLPVDQGAG